MCVSSLPPSSLEYSRRSSAGKYEIAKIEFVVDVVSGSSDPPATGMEYAFQMPVTFDDTRSFWLPGAHDAPEYSVFL